MANTIQMTQTGYDELVKELEELKTVKRSEIAEKIKVARGYGDLSENKGRFWQEQARVRGKAGGTQNAARRHSVGQAAAGDALCRLAGLLV